MKFTYFTRVALPSRAAQAIQILSMAQAFHRVMGEQFSLVSATGDISTAPMWGFRWEQKKKLSLSSVSQYFRFCFGALLRVIAEPKEVIFTRDIAVAFSVVLAGGRALYEAHRQPAGFVARKLTEMLARSSRFGLVAISQALADHYTKHYGVPAHCVLVAHDGVFPENYRPLTQGEKLRVRGELGLPLDKLLVLHTGSLYKGGAELFEYIVKAGGNNVEVIQVGGTEAERGKWAAHYKDRGINNIRFISHQSTDKVRLYQLCADTLFYMNTRNSPIYWCTSPLKLFEYMATGVPILGSAIGSVGEIINETNAYCYDPDQPDSITAAWLRLSADHEGAKKCAIQARSEAENLYSWHRRAERIIEFARSRFGVI